MSSRAYPQPPRPSKRRSVTRTHGIERIDEYAWLQDPKDLAVRTYVASENAYADALMRPSASLQNKLYAEIRGRMIEDDMSVPVPHGPYEYYTRTKKGKQYAIHCRRLGPKGAEEVILDENVLAKGSSFFSLGAFEVSPDHTKLAYSTDTTGNEKYTLQVKDLSTGRALAERIPSADGVAWAQDSASLFYAKESHPFPPRIVMHHRLGEPLSADRLVYEEKDKQWAVSLSESADKQYIFIAAGNFDTSEWWCVPAATPEAELTCVRPRRKRVRYSAEHAGEWFYVLTNERAVNFCIQRARIITDRWETWLAHSSRRALTGFYAFARHLAVTWREQGSEELYVSTSDALNLAKVHLPEDAHALSVNSSLEFTSPVVQFQYQSFIAPRTVFDYDPRSKALTERKRQRVPRWDARPYTVERVWARSKDGTRVPVSLVRPKRAPKDGTPLLLDFYGSYGFTNDPFFSISRVSLLQRGWTIAIAHPRGGGEMGWQWHKSAIRTKKHRTYEDVVAAADHLVKRGYTKHDRLFLAGGSAGGMTLGAVLNMRPDIARGAVCYVPDADVITSSLDTSLGGTLLHYDELGDPRKEHEFRYLLRWSPYEQVRTAEYPSLLIRASMHDIRTPYWEAAKWVARLRERVTTRGPLLLKIEMNTGHGGKSGRYEWIKERAYDYAYLITEHARSVSPRGPRMTPRRTKRRTV
jgi:oligopeptidase B